VASFRALCALVVLTCAMGLGAASAQAATGVVVQQREVGPQLIAQRYEAPPTGQQKLTIVLKPNLDWTTMTALDFDRDGSPDAMVNMYWNSPTGNVVWALWRFTRDPMVPALAQAGSCLVLSPGVNATQSGINPGAHAVTIDKRADSWAVTATANFEGEFGDNARYVPRMTTVYSSMARSLGNSHPATDYLPNAARPPVSDADTSCLGAATGSGTYSTGHLMLREATDRGQPSAAPARKQVMLDAAEGGDPDVLEADVEQWDATQPTTNIAAAAADSGSLPSDTFHPADLVLAFDANSQTSSTTYLMPDGSSTPTGLVVTAPAPGKPTRAAVELHYGLGGLTGDRCYPRTAETRLSPGGSDWGPAPLRLELPVTRDADGRKVVRVALDELIGVYQQGSGDAPAFKWLTATTPGGSGPPDYIPETTFPAPAATGFCAFTGAGTSNGTAVHPSKAIRMSTAVPTATLTPSKVGPGRSEAITLTAVTDAASPQYRFDPQGSGAFDGPNGTASRPGVVYPSAKTARVLVTGTGATPQMAQATISPENTPPTADWTVNKPAPYVVSPSGPTLTWTDASTDPDPNSSIDRYAWSLTNVRTGQVIESSDPLDPAFGHTFGPGDQGDWTLKHTVIDDAKAPATKTATIHIVQPPVAVVDHYTPNPLVLPGNAVAPYDIFARTAADGSLGSEGPLRAFWDWGEKEADGVTPRWYEWNLPYGSYGYLFAGTYKNRVKIIDADGREAISPYYEVIARNSDEVPPTAALDVAPSSPSSGDDVLFTASRSLLHNPEAKAGNFRYDFGDGTPPLQTTEEQVTHRFAGSGTFHVTLTAYDDRVFPFRNHVPSDPLTVDVVVAQGAVDANAPVPALTRVSPAGKVYAQRDLRLSAAETTIVTAPGHYTWDLDGDGTFETDGGTEATLTTSYATAGHRDVRVRVVDGADRVAISAALGIDVAPAPDQAPTVVLNGPDTVTLAGGAATAALDASGSHGNNDDPALRYAWDLDGDGIYDTDTGGDPHATARFVTPGDQTVRVLATDAFGNRAGAAKTIFVRSAADVAAGCLGREQYRTVTYGPVRASACWVKVDRPSAGPLWIARGDLALNGLKLVKGAAAPPRDRSFADCTAACLTAQRTFNDERQGTRIAVDLNDGRLVSNDAIAIKASGSDVAMTLNDAPLDVTLPDKPTGPDDDGFLLHPPGGVALLSLRVLDEAEVRFPEAGTATIAMSVGLPPQMPGAGGDVTLRSTEAQGIILDHLKIEVQTGVLSDYLKLGSLSVEYDRLDQEWTGHAELGLPGIKGKEFDLEVEIKIKNGRFKSIYGAVDGLEIDLGEGIFLQRIRAGVGVDPLDLQGGLGISAGPKILGTQLFSSDGDLRVTFPSERAPFTLFQIAGGTKMLDYIDLSQGVLRFATNGFFEARGGMSRTFGIGYFDADIGGWFTFSKVNLSGNAEAGIALLGDKIKLAEAHAVLSTKGIAACGEIPVIKVGGGVGVKWGGDVGVFTGCDLGPYSEARPEGIPDGFGVRAYTAATRAPVVTLGKGLRSANVAVHGRGAPPRVKLVDAAGHVLVDATQEQLSPKAMVLFDEENATTQIVWKAPPKGKYFVVAAGDSAPIAKVQQAVDAGPVKVRATVRGTGAKRTLTWKVTPALQRGQELTLGEAASLTGAGHDILTTTKSAGSRAFVPQDGRGERRVVSATLVTEGFGRPPMVAGRFSAPRQVRPGVPKGVSLRRHGRSVTLTWAPGKTGVPAGGWRVRLEAGSLRALSTVVSANKRSVTLEDVPAELAVRGEVAGLTQSRMAGTAGKATIAAGVARSGTASAADARPRALTARRAGSKLIVRWKAGAERARGFAVRVRIGKAGVVRLHTTARKPTVMVAGLPKKRTAVRVEVRAERFAGGTSSALVLNGRR
jgi:hypothetical protein